VKQMIASSVRSTSKLSSMTTQSSDQALKQNIPVAGLRRKE